MKATCLDSVGSHRLPGSDFDPDLSHLQSWTVLDGLHSFAQCHHMCSTVSWGDFDLWATFTRAASCVYTDPLSGICS